MSKTVIIAMILVSLFGAVQAQKGEKSISAGPFLCFPSRGYGYFFDYGSGKGLEISGQSNFTNKSSILIQSQLSYYRPQAGINNLTLLSLKGGYRYQFGNSGIFTNVLAGILKEFGGDINSHFGHGNKSLSFTVGAGKRFTIRKVSFIDAGIEYIDGDGITRTNIKATISLLRRPKMKSDT
jgi:hypothetical protein